MSPGTWILTGLCLAGVIAAAAPALLVLARVRALQAHARALGESDFVRAAGGLSAETARLRESLERFAALPERWRLAVASLKKSMATIKHAMK